MPPILEKKTPHTEILLSPDHKNSLQWLLQNTKPGISYELDLHDPIQYQFVVRALESSGDNRGMAPNTFATIDAAHMPPMPALPRIATFFQQDPSPMDVVPYCGIVQLDTPDEDSFVMMALSSIPGGTYRTQVILNLVAVQDGEIVAATNQSSTSYLQGENYRVPLTGNLPPNLQGTGIMGISTIIVHSKLDQVVSAYFMRVEDTESSQQGCMQAPNYKGPFPPVLPCTNNYQDPIPINACWHRTINDNHGCDYWQEPGYPPNFTLPVKGWAQFNDTVETQGNVPIGTLSIFLEPSSGGAAIMKQHGTFSDPAPLPNMWVENGKLVRWDFNPESFPNTGDIPANGALTNFGFILTVKLANNKGYATATFISGTSVESPAGIYVVPQVYILYGCLVTGTMIRMSNNTLKPIETFTGNGTEWVRCDNTGLIRQVHGISRGTESRPCIIIRDSMGHTLTMSEGHTIKTANRGVILAKYIRPGDRLITWQGYSTVTETGITAYAGDVWNLVVGGAAEAAAGQTTLFANDVLVGDLGMQRHFGEADKLARSGNPFQDLPPHWHEEYIKFSFCAHP